MRIRLRVLPGLAAALCLSSCGGGTGGPSSTPSGDAMRREGGRILIVGVRTGADSPEAGREGARDDAARQFAQSILSEVSSRFCEQVEASVKDREYAERTFVQSEVESSARSFILGMRQVDQQTKERIDGKRKMYDVRARFEVPEPFYEECLKNAREKVRSHWYNDPARAMATARYYLKARQYAEMIADLEPLLAQLPPEAYLLIAQAYEKQGDAVRSRNLYEGVRARFPGTSEAITAGMRLGLAEEAGAAERLFRARQLAKEARYEEAAEESAAAMGLLSGTADRQSALKVYCDAVSRKAAAALLDGLSQLEKRRVAILGVSTKDGRETEESELVKLGLQAALAGAKGVKILIPEVAASIRAQGVFRRDRTKLAALAKDLGVDGFIYGVTGQRNFYYLIDAEGALLASSDAPPLSAPGLAVPTAVGPSASAPLVMRTAFVAKTGGAWRKMHEGEAMTSGDEFRVRVEVSEDAFIYMILANSQGGLNLLCPKDDPGAAKKLPAGEILVLPAAGKVYFLDDAAGDERFLVFASRARANDIEARVAEIRDERDAAARARRIDRLFEDLLPRTRGVGVRESGESWQDTGWSAPVRLDEVSSTCAPARYFSIVHK